jgi:hypothetical protein
MLIAKLHNPLSTINLMFTFSLSDIVNHLKFDLRNYIEYLDM